MITKWDRRFLEMAKLVSTWSKDPSTKVGAVITNEKNRVISVGFNGYPVGIKDEGLDNRQEKYAKIIHAEENAIIFANRDLLNCNLYVYPFYPCSNCMAKIIQVGIKKVFILMGSSVNSCTKRWEESNEIGQKMAAEAGLSLYHIGE